MEEEATASNSALQRRLETVLANIPLPFGILLEHMYHIGISQLNGFDTFLFSAARQTQQTAVHVLPMVIKSDSTVYYGVPDAEDSDSDSDSKVPQSNPSYDYSNEYKSSVCPLSSAHVDYILSGKKNKEARAKMRWLDGIKSVPFYSWDFKKSAAEWERQSTEINYTGNEADGERESCVYVSHALLVLPTNGDPESTFVPRVAAGDTDSTSESEMDETDNTDLASESEMAEMAEMDNTDAERDQTDM